MEGKECESSAPDTTEKQSTETVQSSPAKTELPNDKSIYKGVFKCGKKFKAQIQTNRVQHYLGLFDTEIEAAKAYDNHARVVLGPKARTNFEYNHAAPPEPTVMVAPLLLRSNGSQSSNMGINAQVGKRSYVGIKMKRKAMQEKNPEKRFRGNPNSLTTHLIQQFGFGSVVGLGPPDLTGVATETTPAASGSSSGGSASSANGSATRTAATATATTSSSKLTTKDHQRSFYEQYPHLRPPSQQQLHRQPPAPPPAPFYMPPYSLGPSGQFPPYMMPYVSSMQPTSSKQQQQAGVGYMSGAAAGGSYPTPQPSVPYQPGSIAQLSYEALHQHQPFSPYGLPVQQHHQHLQQQHNPYYESMMAPMLQQMQPGQGYSQQQQHHQQQMAMQMQNMGSYPNLPQNMSSSPFPAATSTAPVAAGAGAFPGAVSSTPSPSSAMAGRVFRDQNTIEAAAQLRRLMSSAPQQQLEQQQTGSGNSSYTDACDAATAGAQRGLSSATVTISPRSGAFSQSSATAGAGAGGEGSNLSVGTIADKMCGHTSLDGEVEEQGLQERDEQDGEQEGEEEEEEEELDWREQLYYWTGLLFFDPARGMQVWKGSWVGSYTGKPRPEEFSWSFNHFEYTTPVLSSSAHTAGGTLLEPQSGDLRGFYLMDNDGSGALERYEDTKYAIEFDNSSSAPAAVPGQYAVYGRGDSDFGAFIVSGVLNKQTMVLEMTRRYVAETDERAHMSLAQLKEHFKVQPLTIY